MSWVAGWGGTRMIAGMLACLEAMAFSSVLAASVAGGLALAAALSLVDDPSGVAAGLAFAGTLAVYNVDRLRDLERDRRSAPRRSGFVSTHHDKLVGLAFLGATGALVLGWQAGPAAAALCGAVLLPALFHRRLKSHAGLKVVYVTAAWVTVVVGLPALQLRDAMAVDSVLRIGLIACVYTTAIGANLIASNARIGEHRVRGTGAVWVARGLATAGTLVALLGPPPLRALACIPLAQLAGLMRFDRGERTRLIVIDGSLLLGALATLAVQLLW